MVGILLHHDQPKSDCGGQLLQKVTNVSSFWVFDCWAFEIREIAFRPTLVSSPVFQEIWNSNPSVQFFSASRKVHLFGFMIFEFLAV
jgi:hypothetical protein